MNNWNWAPKTKISRGKSPCIPMSFYIYLRKNILESIAWICDLCNYAYKARTDRDTGHRIKKRDYNYPHLHFFVSCARLSACRKGMNCHSCEKNTTINQRKKNYLTIDMFYIIINYLRKNSLDSIKNFHHLYIRKTKSFCPVLPLTYIQS